MPAASPQYEQFRLSTNRREMIHSKFHQCNFGPQEVYWSGRAVNGGSPVATAMEFQGITGARLFIPINSIIYIRGSYVIMDENAYDGGTAAPVVGNFDIAVQRLGASAAAVIDNTNIDMDGAGSANNPVVTEFGAAASLTAATVAFDVANQGDNTSTYLRCRVTYNVANVAWKFIGSAYALNYRTRIDQWNNRGVYGSNAGGRI